MPPLDDLSSEDLSDVATAAVCELARRDETHELAVWLQAFVARCRLHFNEEAELFGQRHEDLAAYTLAVLERFAAECRSTE